MKVDLNYYLRPLPKRKSLDKNLKIVGFDTEYHKTTNAFKCISISQLLHRNNKFEFITQSFESIREFIDYIILKQYTLIYCFNISADIRFILSEFVRMDIKYQIVESAKILGIIFKIDKIKFMIKDFFVYALSSLDDFSITLQCENTKYPNFKTKDEWEHFFDTCSIIELKKHCDMDTRILCECIFRFRKLCYEKYHVDFMNSKIYSLASFSMKIYRTNYLKYKIVNPFISLQYDIHSKKYSTKLNRDDYEFVKKSYKGGYTDCIDNSLITSKIKKDTFDINDCVMVSFDINSAHPYNATLLKYFPTGQIHYCNYLKEFLLRTKLIAGFCEVEIDFSEPNPFYIPVNCEDSDKNIKFKRSFKKEIQVITSIELNYLLKHNIKIKFIKGLYFRTYDKSFSLFNFYTEFYNERKLTNETNPFKLILKIIMNALYGKFGQKVDCERIINYPFLSYDEAENYLNELSNTAEIKKISDCLYIVSEKTEMEMRKAFMIIAWASLITAGTRLQLLEMIQRTNAKMWDTDSTYLLIKNIPNNFTESNELGGWKIEKYIREFRCLSAKFYACEYWDKKHNCWKKEVKAKGVPKEFRLQLYDSIISGKSEIEIENILKILSYRECCKGIKHTYNSDIFVKTLETKKKLNPKLKYSQSELEMYNNYEKNKIN